MARLSPILLSALLLASCGGGGEGEGDARSSTGEVLEGTISDAMLPVDSVRSEPPLLRPAATAGGGAGSSASTEEATDEGEEGEAEPPAENPEPAAEESTEEP